MIYRALTPDDIKRYRKLKVFSLRESPAAWADSPAEEEKLSLEYYRWRLSQPESIHVTFGAFEKDMLVAFGHLTRNQNAKSAHRANIWAIYVRPEFRKRGIGKELVQLLIEAAKKMDGVFIVELFVVSSNENAKKIYESCGFHKISTFRQSFSVDSVFYDEDWMLLRFNE